MYDLSRCLVSQDEERTRNKSGDKCLQLPQCPHLGGWGSTTWVQGLPEKYRDCLKKPKSRGLFPQGLRLRVMLYIFHLIDISVDLRGNFYLKARLRLNVLRPLFVSTCNSSADMPLLPVGCESQLLVTLPYWQMTDIHHQSQACSPGSCLGKLAATTIKRMLE